MKILINKVCWKLFEISCYIVGITLCTMAIMVLIFLGVIIAKCAWLGCN